MNIWIGIHILTALLWRNGTALHFKAMGHTVC
jgi:hypothetical protein